MAAPSNSIVNACSRALLVTAFVLPTFALAQESAAPATTPRLCIAAASNDAKLEISPAKLRDLLVGQLKQANLARNGRLEVQALNADSEESATAEVSAQHCDFAAYSRVMKYKTAGQESTTTDRGEQVFRTGPSQPQIVPGLQYTVVRTQSGLPILIDRRIAPQPFRSENDLVLLLQGVSDRMEAALEKRLLPQAKPDPK